MWLPAKANARKQKEMLDMNRKALIIGSPDGDGEKHLPGVEKDLVEYKSFLKSPLGGAWRENEIVILNDPGKAEVSSALTALKKADYSLVVFSGHGYVDGETKSTIVELKNGSLNSNTLRIGAPKHVLILDSCRVVIELAKLLAFDEALVKKMAPSLDPEQCRLYYDKRIEECASALVVLFACSEGETAADTSRGGRYSYSLISTAKNWLTSSSTNTASEYAILSIVGAHNKAYESVQQLSGNRQTPDIEKPRCDKYFPFAVIA
jgi:hypothetical protein